MEMEVCVFGVVKKAKCESVRQLNRRWVYTRRTGKSEDIWESSLVRLKTRIVKSLEKLPELNGTKVLKLLYISDDDLNFNLFNNNKSYNYLMAYLFIGQRILK